MMKLREVGQVLGTRKTDSEEVAPDRRLLFPHFLTDHLERDPNPREEAWEVCAVSLRVCISNSRKRMLATTTYLRGLVQ
jgi:hypothetical protein